MITYRTLCYNTVSDYASVAEWMKSELLHFSSGLRAIASRLVVVSETNRPKVDNVLNTVFSTESKPHYIIHFTNKYICVGGRVVKCRRL